jgi:hypothetical protein
MIMIRTRMILRTSIMETNITEFSYTAHMCHDASCAMSHQNVKAEVPKEYRNWSYS